MGNQLERTRQTIEYSAERVSNVSVNVGTTTSDVKFFLYAIGFFLIMLGLYLLTTHGFGMLKLLSNWMLFYPAIFFWIWARGEFNRHYCGYCDKYLGRGCPKMRQLKQCEAIATKIFVVVAPAYLIRNICFAESVGGFFATIGIIGVLTFIAFSNDAERRRKDQDYY